jgi:hypothetical protein
MFDKAKRLILSDRDAARRSLKAEMTADKRRAVETELDRLKVQAEDTERKAAAERERRAAEAIRLEEVAVTRKNMAVAAADFDAAAATLGEAFDKLEALQSRLATLDPGARVDVNMRKWGYVRSLWFAAAPLCRRLGLARTMGSKPNAPLAERFSEQGTGK